MNEKDTSDGEGGILSSASSVNVLLKQGPPDGGLTAWLQVLGAFFMYFNTWGIVSSYGAYQVFYEDSILSQASTFQISTIGSMQSFVMVFFGLFSGPLFDKGHFRLLVRTGSALIIIGAVLQGFCVEYWQLLLAQGACVGLGMGCLAVPSLAVASSWFTVKLPLANGIIVSASGFGGVVYPIMIRSLMPLVGFKFTSLCVALVIAVTLGLSNLVLQQPARTSQPKRAFLDTSALRDVPYLLFVLGCVFTFLGLYTPFFYVGTYAVRAKVTTESIATYLVTVLNASSVLGRILPNIPAITFVLGPLNMMAVSMFSLALLALCLNSHAGLAGLIILLIIYGFFTGAFFSLQPTIFARLTQDKHRIGTRIGMASMCMSFGLLVGAPAGGALIRAYGYYAGWAWSGVTITVGTALMVGSRGLAGGWNCSDSATTSVRSSGNPESSVAQV